MTVPDVDALFDAQERINTKSESNQPNGMKPLGDAEAERLQEMLRNADDTIVVPAEVGIDGDQA